jgi:hypothetical protein
MNSLVVPLVLTAHLIGKLVLRVYVLLIRAGKNIVNFGERGRSRGKYSKALSVEG